MSRKAPLDVIAAMIEAAVGTVERTDNSLTFASRSGTTRIDVRSIRAEVTNDPKVSEVVLIRTELPEQLMPLIDDRQMVLYNIFAGLGALVRGQNSRRLSVISRISVYEGDDDAWELYLPLTAWAALLQGDALLEAVKKARGAEVARLDLPERDDPSRWSEQDFQFAAERLRQVGVFANASGNGLTAEIPVKPGGMSAVMGDDTSLLVFEADMPHPALGSGLFYRLELPVQLDEKAVVFFANKLNEHEAESVDSPPFVGAWCSQIKTGRIAYVGFWPNLLYRPGTVLNISTWMIPRNSHALDIIRGPVAFSPPVLEVRCWSCKSPIPVTPENRGRKVKCARCGTKQVLPA